MKTKKLSYIYPEIHLSRPTGHVMPQFPGTCPACGAKVALEAKDYYGGPTYACGGGYSFKPQIQNHTDKWWGSCKK